MVLIRFVDEVDILADGGVGVMHIDVTMDDPDDAQGLVEHLESLEDGITVQVESEPDGDGDACLAAFGNWELLQRLGQRVEGTEITV